MKNFSIELAAEQIIDPRSREYFSEVLSSFVNGHNRSAAVMLWSVVVADLVYKLQSLRDLYQDPVATSILENIQAKQTANPTNSEWEPFLVEALSTRTQFFEAGEHQHITGLQKLRHLSAHPILNSANLLFHPNKETVRAAIRNALECVLLKAPVFSKKVVTNLINDLAERKAVLPDVHSLRLYLEAKYLKNLHPTVKLELIRTLWKFCFRIANAESDENREINLRALIVIHDCDPIEFAGLVRQHKDQFSEVAANGLPLAAIIRFLAKCRSIYPVLTDAAKIPIAVYARTEINQLVQACFLNDDLGAHIAEVSGQPYEQLAQLTDETWQSLFDISRNAGLEQRAYSIAIKIYCKSGGFNSADSHFARFIRPNISSFDATRIVELLSGIETNDQTYWRGRASIDHQLIKDRVAAIGGIDIKQYPNFNGT